MLLLDVWVQACCCCPLRSSVFWNFIFSTCSAFWISLISFSCDALPQGNWSILDLFVSPDAPMCSVVSDVAVCVLCIHEYHQGLFALFFTFPSGSRWFCSFSFSSHAVTQKRFCSLDLYVCCLTRYSSRDGGGLGKCACLGSLHCWARSNLRHFWWQMVADLHLCWCISPLTAWLWYLYIWGLQIVRNNSKISVSH